MLIGLWNVGCYPGRIGLLRAVLQFWRRFFGYQQEGCLRDRALLQYMHPNRVLEFSYLHLERCS